MNRTIAVSHEATSSRKWYESYLADLCGVFLIFVIHSGLQVPDVNEPHYWTKAAHFWDSEFCKGDLFLESGDAHWMFFATFGYLTQLMPMEAAVLVGRFICWISIAIGWTWMVYGVLNPRIPIGIGGDGREARVSRENPKLALVGTLVGTLWLGGMYWGNWAGEWVVGGCESKGVAYAFVFAGIGAFVRGRITLGWVLLGLASLFHVIVGLWVILTMLAVFIWKKPAERSWGDFVSSHFVGLFLCSMFFLGGAVPAIVMDLGTGTDAKTQAAVEQVYNRLSHHLTPIRFSIGRWQGLGLMVVVNAFLLLLLSQGKARWSDRTARNPEAEKEDLKEPEVTTATLPRSRWERFGVEAHCGVSQLWADAPDRFAFLMRMISASIVIASVGLIVDLTLSWSFPSVAAKVLRYYWFRWVDVTIPLFTALTLSALVTGRLVLFEQTRELGGLPEEFKTSVGGTRLLRAIVACVCIWFVIERFTVNFFSTIPVGDKANLVLKTDPVELQMEQYRDWRDVCDWIVHNTSKEGLWLTPRRQQSFKWRTGRAELACWKDMPQNANAVVEWNARLQKAFRFDQEKNLLPIELSTFEEIRSKWGVRYILLDKRVSGQLHPDWDLLYPRLPHQNGSFAVLEWVPSEADLKKRYE